ncbi:hypothetical protein GCM10023322_81100 [Rugosimonospora acidiphila]|uniref:Uncharacterized protein n=1 Tax=Rugosimonospora acidiphila TaxID=556531 RepID=A0ABP9SUJ1_9ACTN
MEAEKAGAHHDNRSLANVDVRARFDAPNGLIPAQPRAGGWSDLGGAHQGRVEGIGRPRAGAGR